MKGYNNHSYPTNIRKAVFKLLEKDPLLTAKPICKLLNLDYQQYKNYIKVLKSKWVRYHPKERSSIRSIPDDVHNAFYKGELPKRVVEDVRSKLFEVWERAGWDRWVFPERPMTKTGWKITKSTNKALLYKSSLGRIRLFNTGTVEVFVKKPANLGKCLQLFSNAFTKTYLIESIRVVDEFKDSLLIRWHGTYKTGMRLPYMKVTTFEDTHNLIFISGDRTHPDCYEFIVEYHAFVEKTKSLFDNMQRFFEQFSPKQNGDVRSKPLGPDYSV